MSVQRLMVMGPHELKWEPAPLRPLASGEVLVRTRLSALSVSSELSVVEGTVAHTYPTRLGYQTLGVVEQIGPKTSLRPGQRVVSTLGHSAYGIHRADGLLHVPDHVSDTCALCVILGEETYKGIRRVQPAALESVLVVGAGLLGLLTIFNLTRRGIANVSVIEPDPARRELAQIFGAIPYAPGEVPYDTFDVALECSASPTGFAEGLRHLRSEGRCCVLSDGNWGNLTLPPEFHSRELSVVASSDGADYHAYSDWLWQNAEPILGKLFEETVRPSELIDVFGRLRELPRPVSVLVNWETP